MTMSGFAVTHDLSDDDENLEQRYRDTLEALLSDDPQDEARNAETIADLRAEAQRLAEHRRLVRAGCAERTLAQLVAARRARGRGVP
jgi:hypothetical protein